MIAITTAVERIANMRSRIRIVRGGTYAGKTYCILLLLIQYSLLMPRKRITVVAETIPAVKQGALLLFRNIIEEMNLWDDSLYNASERIYRFVNGTTIQFTAYDTPGKAKAAGKRDVLFINEANHVQKDIAYELINRTDGFVYIDFNPNAEFWVDTEVMQFPDASMITLTYRDNEALTDAKRSELEYKRELAKTSKYWANWCRVYLDGEIGQLDNVCVTDWQLIDIIPPEARLLRIGVDFGFHPDPLAVVEVYTYNDALIANEVKYQTNISLSEITQLLRKYNVPVICDSSQPLMINELKRAGVKAMPCTKGAGSVQHGIEVLNQKKIFVTNGSINLIRELRNYIWVDGEPSGEDHAIDAMRYAVVGSQANSIAKRGGLV